jgi:hypothetical protein
VVALYASERDFDATGDFFGSMQGVFWPGVFMKLNARVADRPWRARVGL